MCCCCCFMAACNCRFFCSNCCNRWMRLGCGVRCKDISNKFRIRIGGKNGCHTVYACISIGFASCNCCNSMTKSSRCMPNALISSCNCNSINFNRFTSSRNGIGLELITSGNERCLDANEERKKNQNHSIRQRNAPAKHLHAVRWGNTVRGKAEHRRYIVGNFRGYFFGDILHGRILQRWRQCCGWGCGWCLWPLNRRYRLSW